MTIRQRVRIAESRAELDRLGDEVRAWVDVRSRADRDGQYRTQLNTLGEQLGASVAGIRAHLDGIDASDGVGDVYHACREDDLRSAFTRRIFEYYRDKFDQRDRPDVGDVLRAADEVVWSCWAEAFDNAGTTRAPAPLVYVESRYSPVATPRVSPLPGLDGDADEVFVAALRKLPLPLVALPPRVVESPWWLVLVAHEVGHHVQHDLGDRRLEQDFAAVVAAAATAAATDGPAAATDAEALTVADNWTDWSLELFADLFALLMVGEASIEAVAELEETTDVLRTRPRPRYPAPAVRMAVLREAATREVAVMPPVDVVGWPPLDQVVAPSPVDERELRRDAGVVPAVVTAMLERPILDDLDLPGLCAPRPGYFTADRTEDGSVARWAVRFHDGPRPTPQRQPQSARLAIAGAFRAARRVAAIPDDDQRERARSSLADLVTEVVARCRVEGVRAASTADARVEGPGLVEDLFAIDPEELG